MNEEQDLDRFDVDNDFEDGEFIGGEFFYRAKRQKRVQTEEDRLYGVFAEGGDSDDEQPGRGRGRGRGEKADYHRPVAFVSKGVVNSKPEDAHAPAQQPDLGRDDGMGDDDVDDVDARPSFARMPGQSGPPAPRSRPGSSVAGAGAGLGFTPASTPPMGAAQRDDIHEQAVLPTAFGARIKARAAERRLAEADQARKAERVRSEPTAKADPEFGKFETYSKGIGLKLLQKMGYKPGEGLGRNKDGIVKPVEVKMRPKNQGMGFGQRHGDDEGEARLAAAAPVQGPAPRGSAASEPQPGGKLWKKKNSEARVRREYRTADQVLAATPSTAGAVVQPILDMRGPQARLITNMEHLNATVDGGDGAAAIPMPELQHNLALLVDLGEAEIQKLDLGLRHEQDSVVLLGQEKTRLEAEVQDLGAQAQRLADLVQAVSSCDTPGMALSDIEEVYYRISRESPEEYVLYNLSAAALAQALPRVQALLKGWAPLAEPTRGTTELRRWRPLLEPQGASAASGAGGAIFAAGLSADSAQQDAYTLLVMETVLPALRTACTGWQPREPEALLAWMDAWEPLLPRPVLGHVLDMLVLPALRRAVMEWAPRHETVPIHAWLHPWLHLLRSALEELYPVIRGKLSTALQLWHPSDGSALALLRPWQAVFEPPDWEALLLGSIVPKLAGALAGFVVNPAAQDMAPFQWLMAWADVMPPHHMAHLLDTGFFPKWHQVLHYWLSHTPDYEEVTRWYLGWKAAFPAGLLDQERIRRQFNAALDMMNAAVDGHAPLPATAAAAAAHASRWAGLAPEQVPAPPPHAAAMPMVQGPPTSSADLTLRDLVQRFAVDNGISFMPKPNRFQDGLQVYAFGPTSIVLDNVNSSIRALVNSRWAPVTLEGLLQACFAGQARGRHA